MSSLVTYSEDQIRKDIQDAGLKWIGLKNARGNVIINPRGGQTVKEQLDNIFKLLNSGGIDSGVYLVTGKMSNRKNLKEFTWQFLKGSADLLEEKEPEKIYIPSTETAAMLSPEKIIELITENARLKSENEWLKRMNDRCEDKIDMLEEMVDELRGENNELAEAERSAAAVSQDLSMKDLLPLIMAKMAEPQQPADNNAEILKAIQQQNENISKLSKGFQMMAERVEALEDDEFEEEEEESDEPRILTEEETEAYLESLHPDIRAQVEAQMAQNQ